MVSNTSAVHDSVLTSLLYRYIGGQRFNEKPNNGSLLAIRGGPCVVHISDFNGEMRAGDV